MKEKKQWIRLGILFFVFVTSLRVVETNQKKDSIYVSNTEMNTFAAADTLVIRACSGDGTAEEREILMNKTGWANDQILTGTMKSRPGELINLNAGESYLIPEGYHTGRGQIVVNTLADQTNGTATSDDILIGQTAWANGKKLTGTVEIREGTEISLNPGDNYTIARGFYSSDMKITTTPLSQLTPGTGTVDSISAGLVAWVNGQKVVGTGQENQNSYQQGYNETSGKGSTHLSAISTEMVLQQTTTVDTPQVTRASMTLDVSGSTISNYIGVVNHSATDAASSYQTITATTSNRQCH